MRLWRSQRGNGLVYGVLVTALLTLLVGAIYDVAAVYHYRTWGYQVVGEAARAGAIQGTGLNYATGTIRLDPVVAFDTAEAFLDQRLAEHGITGGASEIQVLTDLAGGTIPGIPPVPQASLDGQFMHLTGPGVGVYLTFSFPTAWLGLVNRHAYQVHVFDSAQVVEVAP